LAIEETGKAEVNELQSILVVCEAENYKLAIELLLWADRYRRFIAVLDSGASHNIIREDVLPHNREESGMIDLNVMNCLQDARGTIGLNIANVYSELKIENEKRRVQFLVMKELAVPILLGRKFMDDHETNEVQES
jgi:hypothetical protein